jgi:acetyltransferase-like isoleucine patch superfamily enzyme
MLVEKSRFPIREIALMGFLPSFLKIFIYRRRGYKIGRNVSIGPGSVVDGKEVEIGDGTSIGFLTIVRGRKITIGRHVKIGSTTIIDTERIEILEDAKINEQVFIGGLSSPESYIRIGKRAIIMQMSFLNPARPLIIGDDAGIGGHCLIFTHGSWQPILDGYPVTFAPVTIGNNVWLPWRVFVMPGVEIGDGATIGASSLVTKNVPAGALAAGSPAKVLRTAEEYPVRKSPEEQDQITRSMLQEFFEHLRYHDMPVEVIPGDGGLQGVVRKGRGGDSIHRLFYSCREKLMELPREFDQRSFLLALGGIGPALREEIRARGGMWVDLQSRERGGSNDIGEEATLFIARFGLRFNRVD